MYREANLALSKKGLGDEQGLSQRSYGSDFPEPPAYSNSPVPLLRIPPIIDLCTPQKPFLTYPDGYFIIIEIFNEGDGIFP